MSSEKTDSYKNISYTTNSTLLENVRSGDDPAWNEFYVKYAGMIYAIGQKRSLSKEDCDDLLIEVMTVFWRRMEDFIYDRGKGKFRSYLSKIAHNCAIQIYTRRIKHKNGVAEELNTEYPADVDIAMMDEWRNFLLEKAMEKLKLTIDTETYQVFYMLFVQNCPVDEVAAVTRKTASNIYVIRSRCLSKLSAFLREFRKLDESQLPAHSHNTRSEF